jgi:hypothetical protein
MNNHINYIILSVFVLNLSNPVYADRLANTENCLKFFARSGGLSEDDVKVVFENDKRSNRFFRKLATKIHPDRCGHDDSDSCHKDFLFASTCKDVLSKKAEPEQPPRPQQAAPKPSFKQFKAPKPKASSFHSNRQSRTQRAEPEQQREEMLRMIYSAVAFHVVLVVLTPCFVKQSYESCELYCLGCVWDSKEQYCLSGTFSKCSAAREAGACQKLGCTWNERSQSCGSIGSA